MVHGFQDYTQLGRVLDSVERLTEDRARKESVMVRDAYGRVAAEEVVSPTNVPGKARSHMDGYAFRAADLKGASPESPKRLTLKANRAQGGGRVSVGETMGIVTGGFLPRGADAVAPVEETRRVGGTVIFTKERRRGDFCFAAGSDVRRGRVVIERGRTIRAQDVGMLALLGVTSVAVFARPRVALIATGSELTSTLDASDPTKVRESHLPIFENLIRESGGDPIVIGIIPDDVSRIASALKLAAHDSDLVLTLGGTSLGDRDLVEKALLRVARRSQIVHGIRIDRGRVSGIAGIGGKLVVMLPGPVQAAVNAFVLIGVPAISRLAGRREGGEPVVVARLEEDWNARKAFAHFTKVMYVRLERGKRGFHAYPVVKETESMSILGESNAFVVVPERTVRLRAGTEVSARLLPGYSYVAGRFLEEG